MEFCRWRRTPSCLRTVVVSLALFLFVGCIGVRSLEIAHEKFAAVQQIVKAERGLSDVRDDVIVKKEDQLLVAMRDLPLLVQPTGALTEQGIDEARRGAVGETQHGSHKKHRKHKHHHHSSHHEGHREKRLVPSNSKDVRIVSMIMHNARPENSSVAVKVFSSHLLWDAEMLLHEELDYGETIRKESLPLHLRDKYEVISGSDISVVHEGDVSDSIKRLPARSEVLLLADLDKNGELHSSLAVFQVKAPSKEAQQKTWIFTYNALVAAPPSRNNVDVLVFNPAKFGIDYSLHRIARNISLHQGQEADLPYGDYQLKVVAHGSVNNVDQFKNVPSLLPPIQLSLSNETRRYLTVQGVLNSPTYKPELAIFPFLKQQVPPSPPKTRLYVLNSDFTQDKVDIEFPQTQAQSALRYGSSQVCEVDLFKGNSYKITAGKDSVTSTVDTLVPYKDGVCILIPDRNRKGDLESFHACWVESTVSIAPGYSWIFTYHAMLDYDGSVEVVIFDESALTSTNRHSLYSIADRLDLGMAVSAMVEVGEYELKVVPENTVRNTDDFKKAKSLIQPMKIQPRSQMCYYGAIQGNYSSGTGRHQAVPPMMGFHVTTEDPKVSLSQCKNCSNNCVKYPAVSPLHLQARIPTLPDSTETSTPALGNLWHAHVENREKQYSHSSRAMPALFLPLVLVFVSLLNL